MSIDEQSRHRLFTRLEEVLGAEEATTLMDHLPPVGWADVATKGDLDHLRAATKGDLDHLRAATKGDLDHLRAATKGDLEHMLVNLEREIQASRYELTASFRGELVALQRHMVFALTGSMVSISALAFAIAQLIR